MITRVLLNGINALSAGGSSVIKNIVQSLPEVAPDILFDIILPLDRGFNHLISKKNKNIHLIPRYHSQTTERFIDLYFNIKRWCKIYRSDLCFTFGDIGPIKLDIPHLVLLQQAMIVYPDGDYESMWPLKERLKFTFTRKYYKKMSQHTDMITVQSSVMAQRVQKLYGMDKNQISVIPSAIPVDEKSKAGAYEPNSSMMKTNKHNRLLFLSAGYPHKNHFILPAMAEELRKRNLVSKTHIFITLNPCDKFNKKLLKIVEPYSDCITNLGHLENNQISGAYKAASALFIPTLVESFGLIYLEAMKYNCPILTSDRDFSRCICSDLAMYFDPLDATSIVDTIEEFIYKFPRAGYSERVLQRLSCFPISWEEVSREYLKIIKMLIR